MSSRSERHSAIKSIIQENKVQSQEHLQELLLKWGLSITQATLSRDLKVLMVAKVNDGINSYYMLPDKKQEQESLTNLAEDIRRGYIGISFSNNLSVISTLPGHANTVAYAIDQISIPEILGTIAGDDTILIILQENVSKEDFLKIFSKYIPDLEK